METYKITHVESETNILYVQADSADSAFNLAGDLADEGVLEDPAPHYSLTVTCETSGSIQPSGHVYSIEDLK